jgi:ABC-type transport system involved in Fe-S cluster assembly fused permease/ATPase subunit
MINHSTLLAQDTALFYDSIHVNKRGRVEATQEFVNAILK